MYAIVVGLTVALHSRLHRLRRLRRFVALRPAPHDVAARADGDLGHCHRDKPGRLPPDVGGALGSPTRRNRPCRPTDSSPTTSRAPSIPSVGWWCSSSPRSRSSRRHGRCTCGAISAGADTIARLPGRRRRPVLTSSPIRSGGVGPPFAAFARPFLPVAHSFRGGGGQFAPAFGADLQAMHDPFAEFVKRVIGSRQGRGHALREPLRRPGGHAIPVTACRPYRRMLSSVRPTG